MTFKKIRGTTDYYPEEQAIQDAIFAKFNDCAKKFGFSHVEPPVLESTELLTAKSGEEIKEQIFITEKRGKENIGLRFEFTASLARMFIEKQKAVQKPARWYSLNKVWRYERPQAGRDREFFQFNCEIYGSDRPEADAEIINLAIETLKSLELTKKDFFVRLNNRKLLMGLLLNIVNEDVLDKVTRAIDKREKISKEDFRKELDFLDDSQFEKIEELLVMKWEDLKDFDMNALAREGYNMLKGVMNFIQKDYVKFDMTIVRGLDYYTGTVFEVFDTDRKYRALCGGGRYDNVIDVFGGQKTPATGFGMGYSTVILLLKDKELLPDSKQQLDYFVAVVEDEYRSYAFDIARLLRNKGTVTIDLMGRSFSKQLKYATQLEAKNIVFVGPDEMKRKVAKIKNIETKEETEIDISDL